MTRVVLRYEKVGIKRSQLPHSHSVHLDALLPILSTVSEAEKGGSWNSLGCSHGSPRVATLDSRRYTVSLLCQGHCFEYIPPYPGQETLLRPITFSGQ